MKKSLVFMATIAISIFATSCIINTADPVLEDVACTYSVAQSTGNTVAGYETGTLCLDDSSCPQLTFNTGTYKVLDSKLTSSAIDGAPQTSDCATLGYATSCTLVSGTMPSGTFIYSSDSSACNLYTE